MMSGTAGSRSGGQKIKPHHDITLIDPVGQRAADQRKCDHRRKGYGSHHAEQRGGPRFAQQPERQGKAQHRVAEQRNDLPDHHKRKVAPPHRFPSFFHLNSSSNFNTDRRFL